MNYFELSYGYEEYADRWHLDEPEDNTGDKLDANLLPKVGPYDGRQIARVPVDTQYPGRALDFSFGYFNFLVLRTHVADLIEKHQGRIQRFPVTLEPAGEHGYEVVFTLDAPKGLVDVSRALEHEFYQEDDMRVTMRYGGLAPRQKGMLSKVYPLHIFADKAKGHEFFRPWEYTSAIVISEALKNDFEKAGVTGIKYTLVS
ncbi:hypothetical protein [Polaromonas sp.]|uniref:hypothetical protein n=1 Tax=Polaromonas sp. TaxID=1869339 RepID=UPI002FC9FC7E